MSAGIRMLFLYWIAGTSLVAVWVLPGLLGFDHRFQALRCAGYGIWTIAVGLIWASIVTPRGKGVAPQEEDEDCASITADRGIYAIIRYPRYLGWLLVYVAVIMLTQHWLAVTFAIPGMACVYLISRWEDRRLVEKLGPAYEQYMQCVPALNMVAGLTRLWRRRAKRLPGGTGSTGHFPEEDPMWQNAGRTEGRRGLACGQSSSAQIKQAVARVPGVTGQEISVEGYVGAEGLAELLGEA